MAKKHVSTHKHRNKKEKEPKQQKEPSSSKRSGSKRQSKHTSSSNKLKTYKNKKTHNRHHDKNDDFDNNVNDNNVNDEDQINGEDRIDNSNMNIDDNDFNSENDVGSNNDENNRDDRDEHDEIDDQVIVKPKKLKLADKTRQRLKNKIVEWLDSDDKIKILNTRTKKYKDAKKEQEETIISIITKLGMDDNKIDVHDDNDNLRSRVYKHKSVTKGSLKEDIIKDALMEAIRDEKKVDQLVKKIESKRPINERYYLKRTKGNKD